MNSITINHIIPAIQGYFATQPIKKIMSSNKQNLSPDRNTQSALSCRCGENHLHLQ